MRPTIQNAIQGISHDIPSISRLLAFLNEERQFLAVWPQPNLLATILAEEPLVTESVTLHAWADKDSAFLAGGVQSVLSSALAQLIALKSLGLGSPFLPPVPSES